MSSMRCRAALARSEQTEALGSGNRLPHRATTPAHRPSLSTTGRPSRMAQISMSCPAPIRLSRSLIDSLRTSTSMGAFGCRALTSWQSTIRSQVLGGDIGTRGRAHYDDGRNVRILYHSIQKPLEPGPRALCWPSVYRRLDQARCHDLPPSTSSLTLSMKASMSLAMSSAAKSGISMSPYATLLRASFRSRRRSDTSSSP